MTRDAILILTGFIACLFMLFCIAVVIVKVSRTVPGDGPRRDGDASGAGDGSFHDHLNTQEREHDHA